jgi:hypothetical protein
MNNYLLNDYSLSTGEVLQSLFVSEYGLRHWALSKAQTECKWGHRIIAVIELCPLIGLVATIIEGLVANCFRPSHSSKSREWLFEGTQYECNGFVSVEKVETILAKLATQCSNGIQFNFKKVASSVAGGTCTAMSLEFLDLYFKAKKITLEKPDAQSNRLVDHLINLGHKFSKSSQEMKDRQAAFNTIEVFDSCDVDYSENKVQSLANYHSLKIDYSSSEIEVKNLVQESLAEEVEKLPEGAFLIRILKPANNEKLEEQGHSLVYIKEHGLGLFYDPNHGLRNLAPSEHSKILFKEFKSCLREFEISKARFYRLQSV